MAIKAPPEAKLQVPHPSQVSMKWILKYLSMCVYQQKTGLVTGVLESASAGVAEFRR
jgi:hypothetical protein